MSFFRQISFNWKSRIIRRLWVCGAFSAETAKSFEEAQIFAPPGVDRLTDQMVLKGILGKTPDGKYYIKGSI